MLYHADRPDTLDGQVRDYLAQHPTASSGEIARTLGASDRTVRKQPAWLARQERIREALTGTMRRDPCDTVDDHPHPQPDRNAVPSAREYLDHCAAAASLEARARNDRPSATLVVPFNHPVALFCCADLHVGSLYTDHALVRRIFDLAARPRWYGISLGDDCQNKSYAGHMPAVLAQGVSPLRQKQMVRALYGEHPNKWIKCRGNHEASDDHGAGDLYTEELAAMGVRTVASPSILRVIVGGQEYVGCVAHRFSGSGLHPAAPSLRLMQRFAPSADFSLTAHRHRPALVQYHEYDTAQAAGLGYGGRKVLGVVGTAQTLRDTYGSQYGDGGTAAVLVLVLHPDRHDVAAFWSVEQAEAYMRGIE